MLIEVPRVGGRLSLVSRSSQLTKRGRKRSASQETFCPGDLVFVGPYVKRGYIPFPFKKDVGTVLSVCDDTITVYVHGQAESEFKVLPLPLMSTATAPTILSDSTQFFTGSFIGF